MTDLRKDVDFTFRREFIRNGVRVLRGEWQALRDDRPQMKVLELHDVSIQAQVPQAKDLWEQICKPNMPWAEDHFQERVGGEPLNPGEQYKNWPWYKQGVEEHKQPGQFSHTYMERFWPRWMDGDHGPSERFGIRYPYGDLTDLVNLLRERPMTRQAYLPIWFPEDLSAASTFNERVPCSLGYHFMVSPQAPDGKLFMDCTYYLRSCDFYRYLWDDVYMAGRLLQWVREQISSMHNIMVGTLRVKIDNLHIFSAEYERMKREYEEEVSQRMGGIV